MLKEGGEGAMSPSATKICYSANKICGTLACGFVSLEGGAYPPPATPSHGFVSQTKPWTQIYNLNWISTPALRQRLRIGQTSTIAYDLAFGMRLNPKLTTRDRRVEKKHNVCSKTSYDMMTIYGNVYDDV